MLHLQLSQILSHPYTLCSQIHTPKCVLVAGWSSAQMGRRMDEGPSLSSLSALLDET